MLSRTKSLLTAIIISATAPGCNASQLPEPITASDIVDASDFDASEDPDIASEIDAASDIGAVSGIDADKAAGEGTSDGQTAASDVGLAAECTAGVDMAAATTTIVDQTPVVGSWKISHVATLTDVVGTPAVSLDGAKLIVISQPSVAHFTNQPSVAHFTKSNVGQDGAVSEPSELKVLNPMVDVVLGAWPTLGGNGLVIATKGTLGIKHDAALRVHRFDLTGKMVWQADLGYQHGNLKSLALSLPLHHFSTPQDGHLFCLGMLGVLAPQWNLGGAQYYNEFYTSPYLLRLGPSGEAQGVSTFPGGSAVSLKDCIVTGNQVFVHVDSQYPGGSKLVKWKDCGVEWSMDFGRGLARRSDGALIGVKVEGNTWSLNSWSLATGDDTKIWTVQASSKCSLQGPLLSAGPDVLFAVRNLGDCAMVDSGGFGNWTKVHAKLLVVSQSGALSELGACSDPTCEISVLGRSTQGAWIAVKGNSPFGGVTLKGNSTSLFLATKN